jgi:hypothetical protein
MLMKLVRDVRETFDVTGQPPVHSSRNLVKMGIKFGSSPASYRFEESLDLVTRKVLYNSLINFGMPVDRVMLIKIHFNKTVRKIRIGKYFYSEFLGALAWSRKRLVASSCPSASSRMCWRGTN